MIFIAVALSWAVVAVGAGLLVGAALWTAERLSSFDAAIAAPVSHTERTPTATHLVS